MFEVETEPPPLTEEKKPQRLIERRASGTLTKQSKNW
jgi:hypothetical protein